MPTISMFLGIIIQMNYNDHNPPHIHVSYQGKEATFSLDGEIIEGELPKKQIKLVSAWCILHEPELKANWELSRQKEELFRIEPLK
ncbi:DUF4160 domain-containing protein [Candidatus Saccharibacteria bacterium]|nr:DUF4160 domain-containing protein [Candidatus Saccharibacteria bacterium]